MKSPVLLLTSMLLALLFACGVALAVLAATSKPAGAATDVLPDLRMANLQDLKIQSTSGRKLLRFSSSASGV